MADTTELYLVVDNVHKRCVGIADLSMHHVKATWFARGTCTAMYTSVTVSHDNRLVAVAKARELAYKWLAKQDKANPNKFVDSTGKFSDSTPSES